MTLDILGLQLKAKDPWRPWVARHPLAVCNGDKWGALNTLEKSFLRRSQLPTGSGVASKSAKSDPKVPPLLPQVPPPRPQYIRFTEHKSHEINFRACEINLYKIYNIFALNTVLTRFCWWKISYHCMGGSLKTLLAKSLPCPKCAACWQGIQLPHAHSLTQVLTH